MPRNLEEKEKCQEKLNQMQKYVPFLDFMIDKIKKTNEASLECQLNKFQVLRSMIAEKNEKYTWDSIIKAEQVIEKLILKLDYKGNTESPKASSKAKDTKSIELKMSASISQTPCTNSGDSKLQTEGSKVKDFSSNTVNIIMKSFNMPVGNIKNSNYQNIDKDSTQLLDEKSKNDVSRKIFETNLVKDLDGFNLSNSSNMSMGNPKKVSSSISSEKASSQEDLLSSSREKLLKSLQNRLYPNQMEQTAPQFWGNKTGHSCSGEASIKNSNRNTVCETKIGSLKSSESSESSTKSKILEKLNPVTTKSTKTFGLLEKQRSNSDPSEINLKQKLKEKLSTDICEVHRVPGKSVGGSLRCLKDSRDHKKSNFLEEQDLFKPDIRTKVNVPSRGSSSNRQSSDTKDKFRQHFKTSELNLEKNNDKTHQNFSDSVKIKQNDKHSKHSEFKSIRTNASLDKKTTNKFDKKDVNKLSEKEEKTEFVKENIQHLPHPSKHKPAELRKTIESSFPDVIILSDAEVISDDSVQEIDEFLNNANKSSNDLKLMALSPTSRNRNRERYPLTSLKILEVDADSGPKNIKPGVTLSSDLQVSEGTGDKICGPDFSSAVDSMDEEEDYVIKLIEETTPKSVSIKKKKGLLDLPMPETSDLFDDISSIESFESSNSPQESRDPRLKKFTDSASSDSEKKSKKTELGSQLKQSCYQITNFESKSQKGLQPSTLLIDTKLGGNQRSKHRLDERSYMACSLSIDASRYNKKSKELKNSYSKASGSSFNKDQRLQVHHPSTPKSYAEYKRMKRKEQEKSAYSETTSREITQKFCGSNISENYHTHNDKNIFRPNLIKTSDSRQAKHGNSSPKNIWHSSKSKQSSSQRKQKLGTSLEAFRCNDNFEENKKRSEIDHQKTVEEKRRVTESEELISPLERLYQIESKPKTGRGYGIQNFKIPKKMQNPISKFNEDPNSIKKTNNDPQIQISAVQNEPKSLKSDFNRGNGINLASNEPEGKKIKVTSATSELEINNEENEVAIKTANKSLCSGNKDDICKSVIAEIDKKEDSKTEIADANQKVDNKTEIAEANQKVDNKTEIAEANHKDDNIIEIAEANHKDDNKTEIAEANHKDDNIIEIAEANHKDDNKTEIAEANHKDDNIIEIAEANQKNDNKVNSRALTEPKTNDQFESRVTSETDPCIIVLDGYELIENSKKDVEKETIKNVDSKLIDEKPTKKCETEVIECDSSVENSTLNGTISDEKNFTSGGKSTIISKEEITQEYVEALIRKSFESGQGKLLLAQAKLFEEFSRKLNSKKLKSIQKIINSESDSSSSSSESLSSNFSSSEKKKKKTKKTKKLKKKGRKNKRLLISSTSNTSSSSSSTESEESDEEKNKKKKKPDHPETQGKGLDKIDLEETETKTHDFVNKLTSKKKNKRVDYPGCFNRKRNKSKQHQKKLIEKILNEEPVNLDKTYSTEPEPKAKPKAKTKPKTELDKLHEDIKNMFISSGVVTATGQRMCRILRNSGGKVDNLDIVKESAKMVEEEKLKKVQVPSRNARSRSARQDSRSRSQSSDKSLDRLSNANQTEDEYNQDPKLKSSPYVLLQQVDLNNFGYGVKVSDNCISFCRKQGRNTAIRGFKSYCRSPTSEQPFESLMQDIPKGIFLARNKRKYQRLNGKILRTTYKGKKLIDVVKNLPLKMAKMKHLQFCEKKSDDTRKKKIVPEKLEKKMARLEETKQFSDDDLVNHAFQLRKTSYRCKVCSQNFRNITEHYKTVHPEHGVLISRLCQKEATRAKSDAVKNNYEGEQNPLKEPSKRNTKTKGSFSYQCRMCSSSRTNDVNVFFTHVTSHTGEVRFQCPKEDCSVQTANGEEIKFHILTKHPKSRYDLYNKIVELYPSPIEGCQLFGFLCSKCNFVQLSRSNIEAHISKQHPSEEVKILKINMSSDTLSRSKIKRMVLKSGTKNSEHSLQHKSNKKKKLEVVELEVISLGNGGCFTGTDVDKLQKQKSESKEDEYSGEVVPLSAVNDFTQKSEKKTVEADEKNHMNEVEEKTRSGNSIVREQVDIKDAYHIQKNAAEDSLGNSDRIIETLEVGPLKSLVLENSEIYYKCQVQNCGLFTKGFDKFEQHLTFNHHKKKWDGLCKICSLQIPNDLLPALNHLKFHILKRDYKESTEELKQNKIEFSSQKELTSSEAPVCLKENISDCQEVKKFERIISPYPTKPLLKVRTLLGDRLSTPKESVVEKEVITINEEALQASQTDKMFTIENVRSLNPETLPGASDINREQVCILKDQHSSGSQAGAGKVILVRSCPTRKIAIRPEKNSLDMGPFNLIQTPVVTHPVVLSQTSTGTPMQLLPALQPVSQTSRVTIKPVIFTNGPTFNGNSNMMPIIRPPLTSAKVLPVNTTSETTNTVPKSTPSECSEENCLIRSKHPIEITVSVSPSDFKCPATELRTKTVSDISKSEKQEDKEQTNPLRIFTSIGGKVVKDSIIYKQMLTKTKLCHLFKCMAVECSFTCNSENVFTRHIGLHEAQRRLKNKKSLKEGSPILKKSNKAFQWQQCAYCCQILNCADSALGRHIILEHGHCIFQCAFCFYRAVSQNYVEIHQNLVHSQILKTSSRIIYKCKPLGNSRTSGLEKRVRKQSVRPYICDQCGENFFVIQEFLNHLTTEHQAVTAYTCHICKNLCFKANRLINHYKLHSYCTYQCAYCLHGTDTEVEMVFHLCNFHFSQPAMMYLRTLPEGVESQGISQLESLKVVVYENDSSNKDSIVEADLESEEETTYDPLKESIDFSEIVAELGINSEDQSECEVTPLLKELASLSDQNAKDVTVKTLLPNAQFSSEYDNINEGCSVLISSGVSIASAQNDEREMSIPLGQLPLEALSIKHVQHSSSSKNAEFPKKTLNLNEVQINLQAKESHQPMLNREEEKASEPSHTPCVHNLPQILLSRTLGPKNVYPSKRLAAVKKTSEDLGLGESKISAEKAPDSCEILSSEDKQPAQCSINKLDNVLNGRGVVSPHSKQELSEKDPASVKSTQPLITNVVSLSKSSGFVNEKDKSILSPAENDDSVLRVKNLQSNVNPSTLISAVNSVDNLQADDSSMSSDANPELVIDEAPMGKGIAKEACMAPKSPDVVILEEERPDKNIETVTLDSDDEKEKGKAGEYVKSASEVSVPNGEIRKEMEILRNQMANETDSLLFDDSKKNNCRSDLSIAITQNQSFEESQSKDILSPIEEAICSLNKKLRLETARAQEKEPKANSKTEENNSEDVCDKPRTRFGSRDRKRECVEEKNGEEEIKKEESCKSKKVRKELVGKELYICGNEQCTFAAENNSSLKDHLYVCDFSRVSSSLMCPHCSKSFKQFNPYLGHLKYHGEKKFHCGLCSFSSAVESAILRHLKQKHKCHLTKSLPRDPPKEEHIVFYPKNYKIDKVDFEENGYSPGDENKLPLQSVYQVNVKCAKCPYFTKVRSNMVRHLKIHTKSAETEGVVVPSTAPTNPVPCLETKEKMFDKMTNLAASSQLAQAEKEKFIALSPQVEAKFPQFIAEQLRFKCCLPDCNYITVDDRMLKHHIKALHNEVTHYSCPHCRSTVHVDIRNTPLEKIGHHLKFHDSKLYKCGHCIYIHYQKNLIEKHSFEKHPDRRCFVQIVRDSGVASEEEQSGGEGDASVWKCARCDEFQSLSKSKLKDHLLNNHRIKSNYQCQHCSMTGNSFKVFASHFASKHPGEKVAFFPLLYEQKIPCSKLGSLSNNSSGADSSNEHFDTTPLWQRGVPRIRHIRGILIEEEEVKTKRTKRWSFEDAEGGVSEPIPSKDKVFWCNLCSDRKVFFTKNEDIFRAHLYQELNYYQFACIACGKMCVDRKDFDKHHARMHPDKPPEVNQTKEDREITFWVEQVIGKQREAMKENKRKLNETEPKESSSLPKKIKES